MSQQSVAYDFARFEPSKKRPVIEEVKAPRKQKIVGFAPKRAICVGLAIVAITSMMIYSRVMLTEVTAEINAANAELEDLNNEYTRLEMEIKKKLSLQNVEEYATNELNMNKAEPYQIATISINQGDEIVVNASKDGFFAKIYDSLFGEHR